MRRRTMLAKGSAQEIAYQLSAPVEHESAAVFDTGFKCLDKDWDFTVFVDVTLAERGSVPAFHPTANTSSSEASTIQTSVINNGGFSVGQWFGAPGGSASYAAIKGVKEAMTGFGWAVSGKFTAYIVHEKGSAGIRVVYRYESNAVKTVHVDGDAWVLSSDSCLRSLFRGTLNALTVYSRAMTDSECAGLLA